jgi:hypothetical protein
MVKIIIYDANKTGYRSGLAFMAAALTHQTMPALCAGLTQAQEKLVFLPN